MVEKFDFKRGPKKQKGPAFTVGQQVIVADVYDPKTGIAQWRESGEITSIDDGKPVITLASGAVVIGGVDVVWTKETTSIFADGRTATPFPIWQWGSSA